MEPWQVARNIGTLATTLCCYIASHSTLDPDQELLMHPIGLLLPLGLLLQQKERQIKDFIQFPRRTAAWFLFPHSYFLLVNHGWIRIGALNKQASWRFSNYNNKELRSRIWRTSDAVALSVYPHPYECDLKPFLTDWPPCYSSVVVTATLRATRDGNRHKSTVIAISAWYLHISKIRFPAIADHSQRHLSHRPPSSSHSLP